MLEANSANFSPAPVNESSSIALANGERVGWLPWRFFSMPFITPIRSASSPIPHFVKVPLKKVNDLALRMGLSPKGDTINRQSIVLPNHSRIVAIPGNSSDSIRGFSGVTMLVIDEASMVEVEIQTAARPMLTQKNGAIWLLSTSKDSEGFFHREFTDGAEDWRRVVVPATECPRFTPEQLAWGKGNSRCP